MHRNKIVDPIGIPSSKDLKPDLKILHQRVWKIQEWWYIHSIFSDAWKSKM